MLYEPSGLNNRWKMRGARTYFWGATNASYKALSSDRFLLVISTGKRVDFSM